MQSFEALEERLDDAMNLAMTALAQVAATGSDNDKVKAASALAQVVLSQWELRRKGAVTAAVLPLFEAVSRNLAGALTEGDRYCPAYELDTAAQSNLLLHLGRLAGA
jgi:hypothetical protein